MCFVYREHQRKQKLVTFLRNVMFAIARVYLGFWLPNMIVTGSCLSWHFILLSKDRFCDDGDDDGDDDNVDGGRDTMLLLMFIVIMTMKEDDENDTIAAAEQLILT